jgi:hypothetical protein
MDLKFWKKALREAERELDAATTRTGAGCRREAVHARQGRAEAAGGGDLRLIQAGCDGQGPTRANVLHWDSPDEVMPLRTGWPVGQIVVSRFSRARPSRGSPSGDMPGQLLKEPENMVAPLRGSAAQHGHGLGSPRRAASTGGRGVNSHSRLAAAKVPLNPV